MTDGWVGFEDGRSSLSVLSFRELCKPDAHCACPDQTMERPSSPPPPLPSPPLLAAFSRLPCSPCCCCCCCCFSTGTPGRLFSKRCLKTSGLFPKFPEILTKTESKVQNLDFGFIGLCHAQCLLCFYPADLATLAPSIERREGGERTLITEMSVSLCGCKLAFVAP